MNEDRSLVESIQFIFNQGTVGEENNQLLPYKYGGENCG